MASEIAIKLYICQIYSSNVSTAFVNEPSHVVIEAFSTYVSIQRYYYIHYYISTLLFQNL